MRRALPETHEGPHHIGTAAHRGTECPGLELVAGGPGVRRRYPRRCRSRFGHVLVPHRFPERGIDLVETTGFRFNSPGLEHQMPAEGLRLEPRVAQGALDFNIALDGLRVVEPRPVDGPCPGFLHQSLQHVERLSLSQDQAAALLRQRFAQLRKSEAETPLGGGPQTFHRRIMNENGDHRAVATAGCGQGRVIRQAQVPAKPDQNRGTTHISRPCNSLTKIRRPPSVGSDCGITKWHRALPATAASPHPRCNA